MKSEKIILVIFTVLFFLGFVFFQKDDFAELIAGGKRACALEGEGTGSGRSCCPGLQEISIRPGRTCADKNSGITPNPVCARCGNDHCGLGENECNCPSDCAKDGGDYYDPDRGGLNDPGEINGCIGKEITFDRSAQGECCDGLEEVWIEDGKSICIDGTGNKEGSYCMFDSNCASGLECISLGGAGQDERCVDLSKQTAGKQCMFDDHCAPGYICDFSASEWKGSCVKGTSGQVTAKNICGRIITDSSSAEEKRQCEQAGGQIICHGLCVDTVTGIGGGCKSSCTCDCTVKQNKPGTSYDDRSGGGTAKDICSANKDCGVCEICKSGSCAPVTTAWGDGLYGCEAGKEANMKRCYQGDCISCGGSLLYDDMAKRYGCWYLATPGTNCEEFCGYKGCDEGEVASWSWGDGKDCKVGKALTNCSNCSLEYENGWWVPYYNIKTDTCYYHIGAGVRYSCHWGPQTATFQRMCVCQR